MKVPNQKIHKSIFSFLLYISWLLYMVSIVISLNSTFKTAFTWVQQIISIYMGLFLIIKYNPYTKNQQLTAFDRLVVYNAGIFIFLTTIINKVISKYIRYIKADIKASYIYHYFMNDRKLGI